MPGNFSFGKIALSADARPSPAPEVIGDAAPFRIAILGDFRGSRGDDATLPPVGSAIRVDRNSLDTVMARLGVDLRLAVNGENSPPVVLKFRSVDDFHPDRILDTKLFQPLREARRRLADPATFRAAAAELGILPAAKSPPSPPPATAPPAPDSSAGTTDLLAQILKQSQEQPTVPSREDRAWRAYLDRITAGHTWSEDPRQDEMVAHVEASMTGLLREILHQPAFQALEAIWRGLYRLTRELETGASLTIDLIDTTRDALVADLISTTPLDSTATYKRLVDDTVAAEGERPWALLVGVFTLEPTPLDVALLWRLGQIARLAQAPFVAAASPRFVGCDALAVTPDPDRWSAPPTVDGWSDLRRSDEAPFLGLALPRVILRSPYGPDTDPIDAFAFEERGTPHAHEEYLWGNPALEVALLIGRAFAASGWAWTEGYDPEISDLSSPIEQLDGQPVAKPCAEAILGQRAIDRLLDAGLMPMVSLRHRDAVRLAQLRSIAEPPAALAVRCD